MTDLVPKEQKPQRLTWLVGGLVVAIVALLACLACMFYFVLPGLFSGGVGSGSTAPGPTPTIGKLASPVIDFPVEGKVGEPVTFDGSKSRPGSSPIASYAWDFGDGSTGSGSVVTHIYNAPSTYQVTMTVTDQNGFGNTAGPVQITIRGGVGSSPTAPQPTSTTAPQPTSTTAPQPTSTTAPGPTPTTGELASPVIDYPIEGKVGEPVTFDGSQSRPGSSPIVSYAWDFGDGSTGSGSVVTHVYNDPGTYQVTMTVTDQDGFGNTAGPVEIQVTK